MWKSIHCDRMIPAALQDKNSWPWPDKCHNMKPKNIQVWTACAFWKPMSVKKRNLHSDFSKDAGGKLFTKWIDGERLRARPNAAQMKTAEIQAWTDLDPPSPGYDSNSWMWSLEVHIVWGLD